MRHAQEVLKRCAVKPLSRFQIRYLTNFDIRSLDLAVCFFHKSNFLDFAMHGDLCLFQVPCLTIKICYRCRCRFYRSGYHVPMFISSFCRHCLTSLSYMAIISLQCHFTAFLIAFQYLFYQATAIILYNPYSIQFDEKSL